MRNPELSPVVLTEDQAVAVAAALASRPAEPFVAGGRAALEKVLATMGEDARLRALALADRVTAGGDDSLAGPVDRPVARAVEEALQRRLVLSIDYTDRLGQETTRRPVEPHLLASSGGPWHLLAWCRLRNSPRWFRLSRISRAVATGDSFHPRDELATFSRPPGDVPRARDADGHR